MQVARNTSLTQTSLVLGFGLLWLVASVCLGSSGLLQSLVPPMPQLILLGITALCLIAILSIPRVRAWVLDVDERALVAFHLTRLVGIYFLVLQGRGQLPYWFAVVGGWGDIAVAVLAIGLLVSGRAMNGWHRGAYILWNLLGFMDILFVVLMAARSAMADPSSMRALQQMPLNLLLTFVVPIIIMTHLVLGYRLIRGDSISTPK